MLSNNQKPKDKKKSFVQKFFSFTMRNNKKSDGSNRKKSKKKSSKHIVDIDDDKKKLSKSLLQLGKGRMQTCTFCDYCDKEIVADFTGQNIIYHEYCKDNHNRQFSKDPNIELQTIRRHSSLTPEKTPVPSDETSFVDSPEIIESRLSISSSDINICDLTVCDELTLNLRNVGNQTLGVDGQNNFLSDTETGSYTFSTIDLSTIKHFGIAIKKVTSEQNEVFSDYNTIFDQKTLTRRNSNTTNSSLSNSLCLFPDDLRNMMTIFNKNDQGLSVELSGDQIMGRIRVFINLIRPIKMLLTARPPSAFDLFHENNTMNQSTIDRAYYNKEVIFWLPRGTTKLLYININCLTMDVISILLSKFNIRNNPKKFALYEHTIKSQTEVEVRKLRLMQCPLKIMMEWCTKDVEYYHRNLETKRFVLQENDPGSVEWDEFSIPELKTFLMILNQEEDEKRRGIECKYDILRCEINRRLKLKHAIIAETYSVDL